MYPTLNKRQKTGKRLESITFMFEGEEATIQLIKLDKPYKTGMKYTVYETTKNAFCSNGFFNSLNVAYDKYNLMLKNCKIITKEEFNKRKRTEYYY